MVNIIYCFNFISYKDNISYDEINIFAYNSVASGQLSDYNNVEYLFIYKCWRNKLSYSESIVNVKLYAAVLSDKGW